MIEKRFPTKLYFKQDEDVVVELWYHGQLKGNVEWGLYADRLGNIVMRIKDNHIGVNPFFRKREDT